MLDTESSLLPDERQREILRLLALDRVVRVGELALTLGVHDMTVRRDLDALAEQGLIERVHGGARIHAQAIGEISHQLRMSKKVHEKERIAKEAYKLIRSGETVAFDASTTVFMLIRMLGATPVQALATSLDGANTLAASNVPFILVGGMFHAPARSFVGPPGNHQLMRLHTDKVFFSSKGFSIKAGFTDAHLPEVEAKERLIAAAKEVIALVDHTKFGHEALGTIATIDQVDTVITDQLPSLDIITALELAGTQLIVAD